MQGRKNRQESGGVLHSSEMRVSNAGRLRFPLFCRDQSREEYALEVQRRRKKLMSVLHGRGSGRASSVPCKVEAVTQPAWNVLKGLKSLKVAATRKARYSHVLRTVQERGRDFSQKFVSLNSTPDHHSNTLPGSPRGSFTPAQIHGSRLHFLQILSNSWFCLPSTTKSCVSA